MVCALTHATDVKSRQYILDKNYWWDKVGLFDLILYVPSTIFQLNSDGSSWVEPRPFGLDSSTLPLRHCTPIGGMREKD